MASPRAGHAPHTVLYLELVGEVLGGGQRSLLDIVTRLDAQRFRPIVVCGSDGTLVKRLKAMGVPVSVIVMPTRKFPWARAPRQAVASLIRLVQQERVALIHANQLRMALYGTQVGRKTGLPVIFHARITAADAKGLMARWLDWYLARSCRLIIAISEVVALRFPWLRGTGRLQVLYNGVHLDAFSASIDRSALRRQFGIADGGPLIGAVGLLEPRKGHEMLLEAFPAVLRRYPQAHLLIVGRDALNHHGYGQHLQRLAQRLGIASHVMLTGFLDDVPLVLGSLDVCVMPVVQPEGLGRVALEAGAVGCPVVATPMGGLREVIEDGVTGLFVPPRDPGAIAEAIRRLLDDPNLARRLSLAARRRVEERFSLPVMIQRLQQLYEEVLEPISTPRNCGFEGDS